MAEGRLESVSAQAQGMADRAGAYVHTRARDMSEQMERLTGRSMESWTREARRYAQQHPLQAVALTIGLGFVLGKILARD